MWLQPQGHSHHHHNHHHHHHHQHHHKPGGNGLVAVAIDKDKNSQHALRWATEHLLHRGGTVILVHVVHKSNSLSSMHHSVTGDVASAHKQQLEKQNKELFLSFHCFCTRKDIQSLDIILEDTDVVKALVEYVSFAAIETLVLGATSRHGFIRRFKTSDIPSHVLKGAPEFCTVFVISKGKVSSERKASCSAPFTSPLHDQIENLANAHDQNSHHYHHSFSAESRTNSRPSFSLKVGSERNTPRKHHDHRHSRHQNLLDDTDSVKSPFSRGRGYHAKMFGDLSESDTDISFVSPGRPAITDHMAVSLYDTMETSSGRPSRVSTSSDHSFGSVRMGSRWSDSSYAHDFSSSSIDNRTSVSSQQEDMEAEMRRLKLELRQTMDMYSTACKEALAAKQKAMDLHRWRLEEERRLEEARLAEEAALAIAEKERAKCEAAQRIAELEAQRRITAEMKFYKQAEEHGLSERNDFRYRKYTIEEIESATEFFSDSRKIGEGGYGPVYKCYLDHTPVAVKVLRPDAAQGRAQFQKEVEVLSCMRHPNMVLLLGACPEYGCLIYEYMAKGSLEDRLFRRGNTPAISWQHRFRMAAEITRGLLFLHQNKPEPIVHRDLKPANILLDYNYVSKISDVGLARLVPPSVADDVTQYRMTSTAGTFCYIDPEYQQTGMLGVKSDVYSLGIVLLQLITAKPAMGLAHHVGRSIEKGTFAEMLDPSVPDWPVNEALIFAKLAVQCAELRRKDRPDLGKVVLPELEKLRDLAEENMSHFLLGGSAAPSPNHSLVSISQEAGNDAVRAHSGYESSKSFSSSNE